MIVLKPRKQFRIPVDGSCISPDIFAAKSLKEISSLLVREGNRERILSDFFEVDGQAEYKVSETCIRINGNVSGVRGIGAYMTAGEILIYGNVGMRLGEGMRGGNIVVYGNADSWAGSMMKGGNIAIFGDVNDYLGASYRGLTLGMEGGRIIVKGNAGNEAGCFMAGGLIHISGNAGLFTGIHMKGGTLLVEGNAAERAGAMMTGGRIIIAGRISSVLPSFIVDEVRGSVRVEDERISGPFYVFRGDVTQSWSGGLFVSVKNNPHLKIYETKIP
ncbi:MAG: formylmethanofuran dehydrogenase subunit C [Candidatus Bathyarchaeia archaeon]